MIAALFLTAATRPLCGARSRLGGVHLVWTACCAALFLFAALQPARGQFVSRLPPVVEVYPEDLPEYGSGALPAQRAYFSAPAADRSVPGGRLLAYPGESDEILQAPGEAGLPMSIEPPGAVLYEEVPPEVVPALTLPPDTRPGLFQKAIFSGTWLPRMGDRGFGMSDLELKTVWGLPFPTTATPLVITPGFAVHYLDGPENVDLPPRLYDSYVQFRWMGKLSPQWGFDAAITPGWFSDFEQSDDRALRLPGHVALAYTCTPRATVVFGAAYLDRDDILVLPVGGLIWNARDDLKFELMFPRPRIAKRVGAFTDTVSTWVYVAAEFAGGTYAVAQQAGGSDEVTYRDYRLLLGIERDTIGGLDARFEIGYVLGRKIDFERESTPDFSPTDTLLLRGGLTY